MSRIMKVEERSGISSLADCRQTFLAWMLNLAGGPGPVQIRLAPGRWQWALTGFHRTCWCI